MQLKKNAFESIQKQPIEFYNIDNGCLWYVQPLFIGPSMELYWFCIAIPQTDVECTSYDKFRLSILRNKTSNFQIKLH